MRVASREALGGSSATQYVQHCTSLFVVVQLAHNFLSAVPRSESKEQLNMTSILSSKTGVSSLDPTVIDKYASLPFPKDVVLAEYVWIDAVGNTRSKTRTLKASQVRLCGAKEKEGKRKRNRL